MMITTAEYVEKLKTFRDVTTYPCLAEHSYVNMTHGDIAHEAAAHPVATKRIRAQTRLNDEIKLWSRQHIMRSLTYREPGHN